MCPEHGPEIDRLEGELLAVLGENVADVVERGTGSGRQHDFARLVERDADELLGAHHRARLHEAPDLVFGAAPPHLKGNFRVCRLCDQVGDLARRRRRMEAEAQVPGHWRSRPSSGKTLAGLSSQSGSNTPFTRICWAMSAAVNCTRISSRFSMPTPCSPVRQPPSLTQSLRISAPHISARSSSARSLAL